jgi:prepilin-type N-terminal cleavage/methylation domain-containing protein
LRGKKNRAGDVMAGFSGPKFDFAGNFRLMSMRRTRRGFSLIELLVVIGIIAVLLALLFPALANAQRAARTVACASNMRQLGQQMFMYANENRGHVIPMKEDPTADGGWRGLGTRLHPKERWPAVVFKIQGPEPETNDPADYCPKIIICPADDEPFSAHTYALLNPPGVHGCKLGRATSTGWARAKSCWRRRR